MRAVFRSVSDTGRKTALFQVQRRSSRGHGIAEANSKHGYQTTVLRKQMCLEDIPPLFAVLHVARARTEEERWLKRAPEQNVHDVKKSHAPLYKFLFSVAVALWLFKRVDPASQARLPALHHTLLVHLHNSSCRASCCLLSRGGCRGWLLWICVRKRSAISTKLHILNSRRELNTLRAKSFRSHQRRLQHDRSHRVRSAISPMTNSNAFIGRADRVSPARSSNA